MLRATGSDATVEHVDPVTVHGPRYLEAFDKIPDIDKVVADTGWRPTLGLDAILARLADFHSRTDRARLAKSSIARLRGSRGTSAPDRRHAGRKAERVIASDPVDRARPDRGP